MATGGKKPSLDRTVAVGDGWDDLCLFAHVTEMLIHRLRHYTSPRQG
jgi:phosphoserine phosphatase